MNFENFKVRLELKSKFFKDTLLTEIQNNNIELLSKKVVPHHKVNFIIILMIRFTDARKLKDLIKSVEALDKQNDAILLEQKRKVWNLQE